MDVQHVLVDDTDVTDPQTSIKINPPIEANIPVENKHTVFGFSLCVCVPFRFFVLNEFFFSNKFFV